MSRDDRIDEIEKQERHSFKINLLRCGILASSVLLMLPGALGNSATIVEYVQLPSGLAAWQRHSFGLYRVCGPLSKILYSLPVWLAGTEVDYPEAFDRDLESRREAEAGLYFQTQLSGDYHRIFLLARILPIIVTLIGGLVICEWSTRLFGEHPGIFSLALWCWMPPVLAHGSLVTSDLISAVMLLLAARTFYLFLEAPNPPRAILAGLAAGLAVTTKFTLLILYPSWFFLLAGRAAVGSAAGAKGSQRHFNGKKQLFGCIIISIAFSLLAVNSAYFFQDSLQSFYKWNIHKSSNLSYINNLGDWHATAWLLQIPLPVPAEFVRGLDFQLADTERIQSAYLMGYNKLGGWWFWYIAAALFKLPIPVLITFFATFLAIPMILRNKVSRLSVVLCLLFPSIEIVLVIIFTTGTGSNAAFRYLLPAIAPFSILSGSLWAIRSATLRRLLSGLAIWLAINALSASPDHLAWQNEVGQILSRVHPTLLGDSLDWGQDLKRLANWLSATNNKNDVELYVYGRGRLEAYLPAANFADDNAPVPGTGKLVIVSANVLYGYDTQQLVSYKSKYRFGLPSDKRTILLGMRPIHKIGKTIYVFKIE